MARKKVHPDQLQLLMTPREITTKYQVWDGDRDDTYPHEGETGYDPREYDFTNRSRKTDGRSNMSLKGLGPNDYRVQRAGGKRYQRPGHPGRPETDEEVYSRKVDEAWGNISEIDPRQGEWTGRSHRTDGGSNVKLGTSTMEDAYGTNTSLSSKPRYEREYQGDESLYESIQRAGVQHPVHLGTQFGSQGKPQIVGGHHRIAVALEVAPNHPIPVIHHEGGIHAARSEERSGSPWRYR